MRALYLASLVVHVLAAAAWIGGMVALAAVLVPVLRREPLRGVAAPLMHAAGLRLRGLGWTALGLLAVSGLVQLAYRLGGLGALGDPALWRSGWGRLLAVKLALVAGLVALNAWHDLGVGPRATRAALREPGGAEALRLRRRASRLGRATLLLSVAALVLGVLLSRGVG